MPSEFPPTVPAKKPDTNLDVSDDIREVDQELTTTYQEQIEPIVRRQIARKLRVSLRPDDESRQNQDALELVSETKVLVLQRLTASSNGTRSDDVHDLDAYVRTVTSNVFNQYLRRKYPRRLSLKNQLRYLLSHHKDLDIWRNDEEHWLCGPRSCDRKADAHKASPSDDDVVLLKAQVDRFGGKGRAIVEFALSFFKLHRAPVALDELVALACEIFHIDEPREVAEPENLAEVRSSGQASVLSILEDSEFVKRLWLEILALPTRHRLALLLNFRDDAGESLITMLPVMRLASIRQIAGALGFSHDDMAKIWNELPWDDNRIAKRLGVTRQQVINLRQSARQTLRRRLWPAK